MSSVWYTDNNTPTPGLGKSGDFYLRTDNGDYFEKVGLDWVLRGTLRGTAGPVGPVGPAGPATPGPAGPAGPKGDPGALLQTDEFVADAAILGAKQITLSSDPMTPQKIELNVYGGIEQRQGIDFLVTGRTVSWAGLALELLLEIGSTFAIRYNRGV